MLAEQGQWLPVDLPRDGNTGSVGGMVARGLAGGLRQRHLGVRDQIIGIGLLRADGVEARAGGRVVKNVAGYDLMRLLCGSWGSLALITDVTLRVQPIRPHQAALVLDGAITALERCRAELLRSTLTPERCDWQGSVDQGLQLKVVLTSVSDAAVEEQLQRLKQLGQSHGLTSHQQPCSDPRHNGLTCSAPTWLVRVVLPRPRCRAAAEPRDLSVERMDLGRCRRCRVRRWLVERSQRSLQSERPAPQGDRARWCTNGARPAAIGCHPGLAGHASPSRDRSRETTVRSAAAALPRTTAGVNQETT